MNLPKLLKADVLIGPVAPIPAFKIGEFINDPLAMYMADALTIPVNAAGLPALACPQVCQKQDFLLGCRLSLRNLKREMYKVASFWRNQNKDANCQHILKIAR